MEVLGHAVAALISAEPHDDNNQSPVTDSHAQAEAAAELVARRERMVESLISLLCDSDELVRDAAVAVLVNVPRCPSSTHDQ